MSNYVILTDSCIDLSDEMAKKMELNVIPLSVLVGEKEYFNYLDEREISFKDFYKKLREQVKTSTSQVNVTRFQEFFEEYLQAGKDILYIGFSSALSGTYHAGVQAADELKKKYPQQKIVTVDSLCASMGQGLLLTYAYRLKQSGQSITEVAKWCEENKLKVCHLFTVSDLNHLKRGGRLSPTKALLGTILHVKPILHVSLGGKLVPIDKTRGRQSSLNLMVDKMVATIENPEKQTVYISHGDCEEDALYVRNLIIERLSITDIIINYVGPVIGSHSGVGTLAVFYLGNQRYV